jgi:hypothetical protein
MRTTAKSLQKDPTRMSKIEEKKLVNYFSLIPFFLQVFHHTDPREKSSCHILCSYQKNDKNTSTKRLTKKNQQLGS